MMGVLQTAAAAVAAWYLALLLLPSDRPTFASIAAVICLGASHGQSRKRALELCAGVVIGIAVASVLLELIGNGPPQIAVLVILAMSAALLLNGGELLVSEAAISALLLSSFVPTGTGFSTDRILEALIGGSVALAMASLLMPPDPVAMVSQVAQTVFGKLGHTLEEAASALDHRDVERAERALDAARGIDGDVAALEEVLEVASETARFSPARRGDRPLLRRYEQVLPQIDYAVRDTRVLVRYAARQARAEESSPDGLSGVVGDLAGAVWALAERFERPDRGTELEHLALGAARRADEIEAREPAPTVTQLVGQVHSVAVDLVRAGERLGDPDQPVWERPTEELLAAV
jgi:uncharacterized membrane protein YgaE (UPF0421/DUF939 family)